MISRVSSGSGGGAEGSTKGGCIDFTFLGPFPTWPLDLLLRGYMSRFLKKRWIIYARIEKNKNTFQGDAYRPTLTILPSSLLPGCGGGVLTRSDREGWWPGWGGADQVWPRGGDQRTIARYATRAVTTVEKRAVLTMSCPIMSSHSFFFEQNLWWSRLPNQYPGVNTRTDKWRLRWN